MNNDYTPSFIVKSILDGVYPYDDNNNINYDLLHSWDTKDEDVIFHLETLANSNDYMVLSLLVVIIENIDLVFIKSHREKMLCILKKAMSHNCTRPNFYFFKILLMLLYEVEDMVFYWDILKKSEDITQNSAISLLKYVDINLIEKLHLITQNTSLSTFFEKPCFLNNRFLNDIDNFNAKIYVTGLHYNGVDKFKIIQALHNRSNYDLIEYIYIHLD